MKLLHISDLHIGKRVHEFSMLEDQKYILNQICRVAVEQAVDGVIIAGDVYDKPIPPAEAVQLLDDFLTKLAAIPLPVYIISGNHDSAERLNFGARLMKERQVYIASVYDGEVQPIVAEDEYGTVKIWLLPFLKPAYVRHALGDEQITTYPEAVRRAIQQMGVADDKEAVRHILVAHQFVTGASLCESEEISVGGLDQVGAELFDDFDYVALGHIHSPQCVKRPEVRYCGTPLKYSFSEADQEKTVSLVTLAEKGHVQIDTIPLTPLREMRKLRGTYMEVTAHSFYEGFSQEDYVQITLTDEEDIPDGLQKLRVIYPNLMRLEYDNCRTREMRQMEAAEAVEEKTELELLEEFYTWQNNVPMSPEQREFSQELLDVLRERR